MKIGGGSFKHFQELSCTLKCNSQRRKGDLARDRGRALIDGNDPPIAIGKIFEVIGRDPSPILG